MISVRTEILNIFTEIFLTIVFLLASSAQCIGQLGKIDVIVATLAICCLVCDFFSRVDNLVTSIWSPSVDSGHVMLDTHAVDI